MIEVWESLSGLIELSPFICEKSFRDMGKEPSWFLFLFLFLFYQFFIYLKKD